ncbi:hypothetical protein RHGRI_019444 [Rhododendron griersonianum]|uniref:DUF4220 domain-containing protein n=1 Tax=Rhododendron griersonianum TaxID=479676 RepID=A0AAV6JDQ4_9ERIC|nr:hypothetical protein RHGRI_019444 [Rhododendron griersonianum]
MPCHRVCQFHSPPGDYNGMAGMRALWENWDMRILILYILLTQLYLHFSGRIRRKSRSSFIIVNVWLLYLFSDLFATIALGKLSKLKVNSDAKDYLNQMKKSTYDKAMHSFKLPPLDSKVKMGKDALRVIWAPLILFYLGGPDTITVLRFEENKLWTRHFLGLVMQGQRTAYALVATLFMPAGSIAYMALLLCIPGIIKYGERVWVVMSNSNDDYTGLVPLGSMPEIDESRAPQPRARLALLAHSWLHTLRPHAEDYECDAREVRALVTQFRERIRMGDEAFKLIEIELGLIYEMLFSKVGTIFTLWGSILRFLSFSFLVSLLVVFLRALMRDKLPEHFIGDDVITIVLLAGAIFLDLAGIVVQLYSDWALIWACNNIDRIKWGANPVLFLHKNIISDRKTWSGVMGQLSLREFCKNYKPTICDTTRERLFGKEKMLKRYKTQKKLVPHLKDLIFEGLREISVKRAVDTLPTSGVRRAEWTLLREDRAQQFKYWSNELEFSRSIVSWHVATEVCYWSDPGNIDTKARAVKMLSDYMMYLLVAYAPIFPFRNICNEIMQNLKDMKELFDSYEGVGNKGSTTGTTLVNKARIANEGNTTDTTLVNKAGVEDKGNTTDAALVKEAQRIVQGMKGDSNSWDWDIMGGVWVEMIRYATRESPVKKHIEELRRGGEFFTHVWLLLMHLDDSVKLGISNSSRVDEHDSTLEDSKDNKDGQKDVKDWDLTRFWG